MGLREIKDAARRDLHEQMKVAALYLDDPTDLVGFPPVPCTVRVHTMQAPLGEVKGTSFDYAERHEAIPRIVFLWDEVPEPSNGSVVTIKDPATLLKEAYRIDNRHPRDGITVTADVTGMTAAQYAGLPFPEV